MNAVSSNYKDLINTTLSLTPKFKIVIDGVEYLSNVIKTFPKISHSNTKFIGGFPAKTLNMEIYDLENTLDLKNKEIEIYKGFVVNNSIEYVKQGVFIAKSDNITTNISSKTISLSNVQDRTQLLNDKYESSLEWSTNHTGLEIVQEICTKKGITLASNTFNFANYSFKQPNFPENTTNREVISRLAEIGGEIALFNCDGELVIKGQYTTGDTIQSRRYEKLSKENAFVVNTVVLGKEGIDDDIVYPESIATERVEFKILDNPFVDLYREEMIEEVAKYVVGMSYTPYKAENVIDGFIYELNDVVSIVDKNGNTFNAVILDVSNNSRIKSTIKADVGAETKTNYNLAGSKTSEIAQVKLEVDHINNQIKSVVSTTESVSKTVDDLEKSIDYFSVDLSQYTLTIPTDSSKKPLETKNYDVSFYGYYKGQQVTPDVSVSGSNTGITTGETNTYVRFSVNTTTAITNLSNDYTLTFTYGSPDGTYTLTKKVTISLSIQGKDGEKGADGTGVNILGSYNSLQELQQAHPTGSIGDAYLIQGNMYVWSDETKTWENVGNIQGPAGKDGNDGKDGKDGINGTNGKDGTSYYFYVRYSANSNGNPMTEAPQSNTQYMGVASTTSSTAPTSYSAYTWSKIKGENGQDGKDGEQGIQGQTGADGKSSYLHIKYSDDGKTFTANNGETVGRYRGELVDNNPTDSTTFSDYTWYDMALIVDEQLEDIRQDVKQNTALIEQTDEQIRLDVAENYTSKGTFDEFKKTTETELTMQSDALVISISSIEERMEVLGTNIDGTTGEVTSVKTGKGFTFNDEGLNINDPNEDFNTQITNRATQYKNGDEVITETSKDGFMTTDLKEKGTHQYSYNGDTYDFVSERIEVDGEYAYAHFYNGGDL